MLQVTDFDRTCHNRKIPENASHEMCIAEFAALQFLFAPSHLWICDYQVSDDDILQIQSRSDLLPSDASLTIHITHLVIILRINCDIFWSLLEPVVLQRELKGQGQLRNSSPGAARDSLPCSRTLHQGECSLSQGP